jgi:hypothetical protein
MGPVVHAVSPDVALAACAGLALCAALAGWLGVRAARRRRAVLDAELARARHEVDSLSRKVAELSDDVTRAARRTADQDREYVITSLGDGDPAPEPPAAQLVLGPSRAPVGKVLEDQLVEVLARQPVESTGRARAVQLVIRTVSVGHGLRRALSPDVLDRAAAEAHVARRRSRRQRRRQVRHARRLVRAHALSDEQSDESLPAESPRGRGRDVA